MDQLKDRRWFSIWLLVLFTAAIAIRVSAALVWQNSLDSSGERFRFGDSDTYWVLAEKIFQGKPYEYGGIDSRAFRAPGYPLFLASTFVFFGSDSVLAARLMGCVLGVCNIAMLMFASSRLANQVFNDVGLARLASLCCGLLATLYLGAIGISIFILSEAVFCPLMTLSMIAWVCSLDSKSGRERVLFCFLAGAATGAACLCRPSWILWPGLLAGLCILHRIYFDGRNESTKARVTLASTLVLPLTLFLLGTITVMSPWWIRNYLVFESFVPTTLQVGASLYDGLHDGASGASDEGMQFTLETENELREQDRVWHETHASFRKVDSQAEIHPSSNPNGLIANDLSKVTHDRLIPFEIRLNKALFSKAISWTLENPYATIRLALIKFQKMWTPWPTAKEIGGLGVRTIEAVGYLVIVGFAIYGFVVIDPKKRFPVIIYASPVLYFAVLHTIFVGSVRYRQPAILVLTIISGIGAAWMLNQIELKRKRRR